MALVHKVRVVCLLSIVAACVGGACEADPVVEEGLGKLLLKLELVKLKNAAKTYQLWSVDVNFGETT
jgi:hypothetical protein